MDYNIPEILIADDSKSNRLSLAAATIELDADILIAASGLETIRLATEHQPAVIILDADMPDMDGYQVINQLSGNGRTVNIPVILMETNFASQKADLHGGSVQATEILYKPINQDQLVTKLENLLQLSRYRGEIERIREFEDEMGAKGEEGIVGIDAFGRIKYCNPAMVKLLHTSYSVLLGTGLEAIFEKAFHSTDPSWNKHTVATALAKQKTVQVKKATLWTNNGSKVTTTFVAVPIKNHYAVSGLLVFRDISRRSKVDQQLTSLSTHDFLTGLANRFKFEELLSGLIDLYNAKTNVLISRKRSSPCAVLYIGLDHFSHINKGLGHNTGDKLLQGVAHRIKNALSDLDIAARIGGDEFTVALTHMFDASHATEIAKKIQAGLDQAFLIEGNEIFTSASIGIATYPECGDNTADLLTNASTAMQSAKDMGGHKIQFFTDSLNQNYLNKIELEAGLKLALSENRLKIAFQPYVEADSNTQTGFYGALFEQREDNQLLDTAKVLDSLDSVNLQTQLVYKVLKDSCDEFVAWTSADPSRERLNLVITFPAFHMISYYFINNLKSAIDSSGITPSKLMLEIRDSKFDFNLGELKDITTEMANMGVKLSLNLFSSTKTPLTHLFQLNLDLIRIDIQALDNITQNPKSAIFFKSVISMAHDLGIEVIADNINQQRESSLVQSLGANALMGDLIGTPRSLEPAEADHQGENKDESHSPSPHLP